MEGIGGVEAQLSLCTDVDSQCYTSLTLVLSFLVVTAPLSPSNKQARLLHVDPRQFDEMRKSATQRVIKDRQDSLLSNSLWAERSQSIRPSPAEHGKQQ